MQELMQDRLKFRVFDNDDRKMHDVIFLNYENNSVEWYNGNNKKRAAFIDEVPIVQCTGLKDKNGKLIYEGDILKGKKNIICSPHSSRMIDKVGVVEIPQNMFVATCRDVKNNCTLFCQNDWIKTEVIGNIYENPELLEE